MRRITLCAVLVATMLTSALSLLGQSPNYQSGPVWRVIYLHIKTGQGDAFWNDVKQNLKPVWDAEKQEGLIADYKFYTNPTSTHPDDWNVAIAILYPNYAALDGIDQKGATISSKHYGSRDAMLQAGQKRSDYATVISNQLAREVTLK